MTYDEGVPNQKHQHVIMTQWVHRENKLMAVDCCTACTYEKVLLIIPLPASGDVAELMPPKTDEEMTNTLNRLREK